MKSDCLTEFCADVDALHVQSIDAVNLFNRIVLYMNPEDYYVLLNDVDKFVDTIKQHKLDINDSILFKISDETDEQRLWKLYKQTALGLLTNERSICIYTDEKTLMLLFDIQKMFRTHFKDVYKLISEYNCFIHRLDHIDFRNECPNGYIKSLSRTYAYKKYEPLIKRELPSEHRDCHLFQFIDKYANAIINMYINHDVYAPYKLMTVQNIFIEFANNGVKTLATAKSKVSKFAKLGSLSELDKKLIEVFNDLI